METTNNEIKYIDKGYTCFTCRYLKAEDIDGIVKLQDIVSKKLKETGTPRHIVPRSREHFLEHLSDPHAMYGIFDKGKIVAQAIFRISDVSTEKELGVKDLPDFKEGDKLSVAQGVLVHPDCEGLGLMSQMLSQWFGWCKEKGVRHLAARTESSHNASRGGFLSKGFNNVATIMDYDHEPKAEVNVLHMELE